jgi:hypothetical protein
MGAIPQLLLSNRTGESVLLNFAGKLCGLFLRRASEQSGFKDSIRLGVQQHELSQLEYRMGLDDGKAQAARYGGPSAQSGGTVTCRLPSRQVF